MSDLLETPASDLSEPRGEKSRLPRGQHHRQTALHSVSFPSGIHQPKEKSFVFLPEKLLKLSAATRRLIQILLRCAMGVTLGPSVRRPGAAGLSAPHCWPRTSSSTLPLCHPDIREGRRVRRSEQAYKNC